MTMRHTYRLKFESTLDAPAADIEFEANDAYHALTIVRETARHGTAELLEDGRPICRIRQVSAGVWQVSPLVQLVAESSKPVPAPTSEMPPPRVPA